MRILFLDAYFSPEIVASTYLIENRNQAFAASGYSMVAIVPSPTRGVSEEVRRKYKRIRHEKMFGDHLQVIRFPMFRERNRAWLRVIRYFLCGFLQFFIALFVRDIDVILIASTPPTQGLLGVLLKRLKKAKFVYNLQDIFPESLASTGLAKQDSFFWRAGRWMENYIYGSADSVVVISESYRRNIIEKGVPEAKIEVIYNWIEEDKVFPVVREQNVLIDRYNLDPKKFYVTYCGNIGLTQNMDLLAEVAKDLEVEEGIQFVLIGKGVYKSELEGRMEANKAKNIRLLPLQPYEDIAHVFSLGDIGLVISKKNVGKNSLPSKTWSIMSAERPVLASYDLASELCSIISEAKCGVCVPPNDKEELKKAILSMYASRSSLVKMGRNGREYALKKLSKATGTAKFIDVINRVLESK